jgi:hypothetical protein
VTGAVQQALGAHPTWAGFVLQNTDGTPHTYSSFSSPVLKLTLESSEATLKLYKDDALTQEASDVVGGTVYVALKAGTRRVGEEDQGQHRQTRAAPQKCAGERAASPMKSGPMDENEEHIRYDLLELGY